MTTTTKEIGQTYTIITSETDFIAQNISQFPQEWVRASTTPAETVRGIVIEQYKGLDSDKGSGNLYGRGIKNGGATTYAVVIT